MRLKTCLIVPLTIETSWGILAELLRSQFADLQKMSPGVLSAYLNNYEC